MGEEEKLRDEIVELKERKEQLEGMLAEVMEPLGQVRELTSRYFHIMDVVGRFGAVSPDMVVHEIKDGISSDIIKVLSKGEELNISQIAERLRGLRGTSSRRIVRDKLGVLEEKNIVERIDAPTPRYKLSDEVAKKWAKVLGFIK